MDGIADGIRISLGRQTEAYRQLSSLQTRKDP
jgi:hypothetical protein